MTRPLTYDWATFSLNNGEADYDVATQIAALFSNVPHAHGMAIFSNKAISMKINSSLMPSIILSVGDFPFQSPNNFLEISNIFLTNSSGSSATIKVLLW